ncbi:hypothetical protein [Selenomonas sp. AE3005]|uniref:hypothetical protein n=1 Tax=Selenomonas sp. AE3005 TaxID=1485543 RepID=UPI000485F512|nr:hypothetical protein [Selenomonas sp. AE3005]
MGKENRYIYEVKAEAFLVYDKSLCEMDSPFVQWLRSEGFSYAGRDGNYGICSWAYVNITHKMYAYGKPFIPIVKETGNHAITIDEFKTIYAIYKKYEGKKIFSFGDEQDEETEETLEMKDPYKPNVLNMLKFIWELKDKLNQEERKLCELKRDYTLEEFRDVVAKHMGKIEFFQQTAEKAGVPLDQYCREYFDRKQVTAANRNESVREYYRTVLKNRSLLEDCAENLARNWYAAEMNYTLEEFKAALAKKMEKYGEFQYQAKELGIPLDRFCRAYVDYKEAEDDDKDVQHSYEDLFSSGHSFAYLADNLAYTWDMIGDRVSGEKISQYLK